MSASRDSTRLRQMCQHAEEILLLCKSRNRSDLDDDRLFSLAIVRLLEIVGEAAARVSQPLRVSTPQIPWSQIVGLRNRLIHGYDDIDHDIVWDIIQLDLPPLVEALRLLLQAS
jgi:uncharacterized protein with HEPN domain